MNKKNIIKVGVIATAIIALFSNANDKVMANSNCQSIDDSKVKYVNATLVDINAEMYNASLRGISKNDYYSKSYSARGEYDKDSVLFGYTQGKVKLGIQNEFTDVDVDRTAKGVLQGLAESKLVNGNLKIVSKFRNGTTLFPTSGATGSDKPYNEILANWKFPFLKEKNGYYSFNSEQYHVYKDYQTKTFKLHKGEKNGFFPFNNCDDDTFDDNVKNMYFTARIDIPFFMTKDGKVLNSETGKYENMVFKFSGDDDVWVYVDDTLVLDLGGTHIKQDGKIDFATNQSWCAQIADWNGTTDYENVYNRAFKNGMLSQGKHTLKVFYMERAGGVSNLFASFNLQSSGVEINHIDKYAGNVLETESKSGPVGNTITTDAKNFEGYELIEAPKQKDIVLTEDLQKVNYYYAKIANVNTQYIDIADGRKIAEDQNAKYHETQKYTTASKQIKDYTLVKDTENTTGTIGRNNIDVKYYYKYNAKLTANYIDKTSKKVLATDNRKGLEGDKVITEEKKFENYVLISKPESNENILTKKDQTIYYYYLHQSKIKINYIDKTTNENLDKIEDKVTEGTVYTTKEKQFENYKLVQKPETENYLIAKEDIEVNYYYQKLKFNLKIDMNFEKTIINDNYYELKNKIGKVETQIREANSSSSAKIYYKIKVTNDQERKGDGTIIDTIPNGYSALKEDNKAWELSNGKATLIVKNLLPNESREFEIVLTKNEGNDICGIISNKVRIDSNGIEETTLKDNEDKNDLVIIPRTGKKIASYGLITMVLSLLFVFIKKKRKVKLLGMIKNVIDKIKNVKV